MDLFVIFSIFFLPLFFFSLFSPFDGNEIRSAWREETSERRKKFSSKRCYLVIGTTRAQLYPRSKFSPDCLSSTRKQICNKWAFYFYRVRHINTSAPDRNLGTSPSVLNKKRRIRSRLSRNMMQRVLGLSYASITTSVYFRDHVDCYRCILTRIGNLHRVSCIDGLADGNTSLQGVWVFSAFTR